MELAQNLKMDITITNQSNAIPQLKRLNAHFAEILTMTNSLERKLQLLVGLGYYPFWHNGCDGDKKDSGWVISQEYFSCKSKGIFYGRPRYGSQHYETLEAAADETLIMLRERAEERTKDALKNEESARKRLIDIANVMEINADV
jgi:hypothetical protein